MACILVSRWYWLLLIRGTNFAAYFSEGIRPRSLRRIEIMATMTTWNPTTHNDYDVLKGRDVFSADGEKVGEIAEILHPSMDMPAARGKHFFLLDPGLMKDWFGGFN